MAFQDKRWMLVTLVIVLVAGGAAVFTSQRSRDIFNQRSQDIPRLFGGSDGVQIVRQAKTVLAWRVVGTNEFHELLYDYEMRGKPVELSTSQAQSLRNLLLDHDSYEWDVAKGCMPIYGVRVQFLEEDQSVDVMFCFECDILTIFRNGKITTGEDFDTIRGRLLEIIKPLFPDDELIQGLEE